MKKVIFALAILSSTISYCQFPKAVVNTKVFNFNLTSKIPLNITDPKSLGRKIMNGSITNLYKYSVNNIEHLVLIPSDTIPGPQIHFIKKNNEWVYESSYSEGAMGASRDSEIFDNVGSIVFADHGLELRQGTWPNGHIMLAETNGERLVWTTISTDRSFYHSISTGDLNNDGLRDIIGLNMGTKGNWYDNLHTYLQNKDGTFTENRTILVSNLLGGRGAGAVLIKDLFGDSRPEVIKADYGFNSNYQKPSDRYSFMIFSYNTATNKYELSKDPGPIGVYTNNDRGTTSIKAADFNKDGALDLAIATEGTKFNGIEIWMNDGKGNFTPSNQKLEYTFDQLQFREFEVFDYDKDGYPDIFLNPWSGKLFKDGSAVFMDNLIWKNSVGIFGSITKGITIPNINPTFMKAFFIDNQITYMGIKGNIDGSITLNEINPNY